MAKRKAKQQTTADEAIEAARRAVETALDSLPGDEVEEFYGLLATEAETWAEQLDAIRSEANPDLDWDDDRDEDYDPTEDDDE